MKTTSIIALLLLISFTSSAKHVSTDSSLYRFSVDSIEGNGKINFSRLSQHNLLLVTINTRSQDMVQLPKLQKLQNSLGDSLTIILLPVIESGNDASFNTRTAKFMRDFSVTLTTAGGQLLSKSKTSELLQWLKEEATRQNPSFKLSGSYQKFLFNAHGTLVQVFDTATIPTETIAR